MGLAKPPDLRELRDMFGRRVSATASPRWRPAPRDYHQRPGEPRPAAEHAQSRHGQASQAHNRV